MKKLFLLALLSVSCASVAQETGYFQNPVIRGDMADPSIIKIKNTYFATGTSSEWAPFYPVFTSKDLINWTQTGHIFSNKPEWTSHSFWAPELYVHNRKVYCYYTARRKSDNVSYIGVATAKSPLHEFTDHGPIIEYGSEAIDAFIYDDGDDRYISWKAYGLDNRPIELLGSRLSDDGLRLEGEPFTLLKDDKRMGMEGQYHFKKGEYYYIVYAANGCCGPGSNYDVYVARSKSFKGPYEKYQGNPILHGGKGDYTSCGHGTAVVEPDGRMFFMCHAYLWDDGFFVGRQPILQEMTVNSDGWVEFKTGSLAVAKQPVPFKGTVQKPAADFSDAFKGSKLKLDWSWNYPYSEIHAATGKEGLQLSGTPKPNNLYGTALCLRAMSPGYSYETRVANSNASMKGLAMYGDDKNLIAWGIKDSKLSLIKINDGRETIVWESEYDGANPYLKIEVEDGTKLTFHYSPDGKVWTKPHNEPIDFQSIVRWDRVARPGLIHIGDKEAPAIFSYFKLTNNAAIK